MKIRAIGLILTLGLGLLAAPPAQAQQPEKVYRIGVLSHYISLERLPRHPVMRAIRDLGWVEGENLVIEARYAEGKYERLPELAADLVRLNVDVIVAFLNPAILAAKQATASIPIVMIAAADPVGIGLVASLARPGGNITGTTVHTPEVAGKLLEVLRDAVPKVRRVAVLTQANFPGAAAYTKEAKAAAGTLGITLEFHPVRQAGDIDAALAKIRQRRPDAVYVTPTGPIHFRQAEIFDFLASNKLPSVSTIWRSVKAGVLMYYGFHHGELTRRSAAYVDKILKGAKPADLPVEQPTRFELIINMKTAKALGLTIPESVLFRADKIIE